MTDEPEAVSDMSEPLTGDRVSELEPSDLSESLAAIMAANRQFYAAFETADFDAMQQVWADDDGVVCVHPAAPPIRGRSAVMRSWLALMAQAPYIQFFLTDVDAHAIGDIACLTCTENVLSAGADTPPAVFAGGSAAATNVFRRTPAGWRLWVHHASPVMVPASADPDDA